MKISLLTYSFSHNCLGRAYLLAEILKKRYEVEIIGPIVNGVWKPCDDKVIPYKKVKYCHFPGFHHSIEKMLSLIDGDVVYAVKPRPASFGIGIMKKILTGKPLILDIDDNEDAFADPNEPIASQIKRPDSNLYVQMVKQYFPLVNGFTLVSQYLSDYYGVTGPIIPHCRDNQVFDPALYDSKQIKKELGLENYRTIIFCGTARPHKGIEELIAAVRKTKTTNIRIIFLGVEPFGPDGAFLRGLIRANRDITVGLPQKKIRDIPKYISAGDVVILPQRKEARTVGQIPAKLIDAMAMAKPIISTAVSDIPLILEGCGITVEPGNITALSQAIDKLFADPIQAKQLGINARNKFLKGYSYDAIEETLFGVFSKFEGK